MMKKIFATILALALTLSLVAPMTAFAVENDDQTTADIGDILDENESACGESVADTLPSEDLKTEDIDDTQVIEEPSLSEGESSPEKPTTTHVNVYNSSGKLVDSATVNSAIKTY